MRPPELVDALHVQDQAQHNRKQHKGKAKDALDLLATIGADIPQTEQHLLAFLQGAALQSQERWGDAIDAYRKAADDPNNDRPGYAWNNLGAVLKANGENDEAIKAHRKAAQDPNKSDKEVIEAMEELSQSMPELFDSINHDALANALEEAMGSAAANGAFERLNEFSITNPDQNE